MPASLCTKVTWTPFGHPCYCSDMLKKKVEIPDMAYRYFTLVIIHIHTSIQNERKLIPLQLLPKYNEASPGITFRQHHHYVQQITRSVTMRVIQFRAIAMFYSRSQSVFHYGKTYVSITVISLGWSERNVTARRRTSWSCCKDPNRRYKSCEYLPAWWKSPEEEDGRHSRKATPTCYDDTGGSQRHTDIIIIIIIINLR